MGMVPVIDDDGLAGRDSLRGYSDARSSSFTHAPPHVVSVACVWGGVITQWVAWRASCVIPFSPHSNRPTLYLFSHYYIKVSRVAVVMTSVQFSWWW